MALQGLTPREVTNQSNLSASKPLVYAKVLKYPAMVAAGQSIACLDVQYNFLCNFHCVHCAVSSQRGITRAGMLTPGDIKHLCDQGDALGLAHFSWTGGEPLVVKEFDKVIEAIGPERFHIHIDTNGWFIDDAKARHLKAIGVDKIQLSLDGLDAQQHDAFRRKPGSFYRVLRAAEATKAAGMSLQIATFVDHDRAQTLELERFLDFTDSIGAVVNIQTVKLMGELQGRYDMLLTDADMVHLKGQETRHHVTTHLTPFYGIDMGCMAVKKMLVINAWGDAMPCPGMRFVLGNIRTTPLADILAKGMRYFGAYEPTCRASQDVEFNRRYVARTENPLPIEDVMPYDWHVEDMA
jgi:MoaA/NifB/PqqE/SkfB family radical SAM enzyme